MSHAFYVGSAFAISAVILAILVGWVVLDLRRRRGELEEMERLGMTRRSTAAERSPE